MSSSSSYLDQVPSVIDTSAGIFSSIMSTFWENTAIKSTADKVTTLIINNYTVVFGLAFAT